MKTLYVTVNGALISKEVLRFIVRTGSQVVQEVPAHALDQIVIIGKAEITHDAIVLAFKHNIEILFLSQRGEIKAELFPPALKMVQLRMAQYQMDENRKLKIACAVVMAKIANCRSVLQRLARGRPQLLTLDVSTLSQTMKKLEDVQSIDSLMGYEGTAAADYFQHLASLLRQELGFGGRNRRPPKDPVNAMLSFGYALLYRLVSRFTRQYGLDPFLGCLHSPQDRRLSLALDLMEEFRPILVDRAVIRLVNQLKVRADDFRLVANGGVHMSQKAIGLLIQEWEDRLEQRVFYARLKKHLTWRQIVMQQTALYRRVVLAEEDEYQGIRIR